MNVQVSNDCQKTGLKSQLLSLEFGWYLNTRPELRWLEKSRRDLIVTFQNPGAKFFKFRMFPANLVSGSRVYGY